MKGSAVLGVDGTAPPRLSGSLLTCGEVCLDEVWPEVNAELVRYLRRRGATACQAQDVAQDVAVKVLMRDVAFTCAQDLLRWCYPVARNALIDLQRAARRVADDPEQVPETPAGVDVHAVVEARIRLERVLAMFRRLDVGDQEALRPLLRGDELPAAADRREATRLAVRRHRARARLTAMVGPAAAAIGWALGNQGRPARRIAPAVVALPLALAVATGVQPFQSQVLPPAAPAASPAGQGAAGPGEADVHRGGAGPVLASVPAPTQTTAAFVPAVDADRRQIAAVAPAEGVLVRVETHKRAGNELVCVAHDGALSRTCLEQPAELPAADLNPGI